MALIDPESEWHTNFGQLVRRSLFCGVHRLSFIMLQCLDLCTLCKIHRHFRDLWNSATLPHNSYAWPFLYKPSVLQINSVGNEECPGRLSMPRQKPAALSSFPFLAYVHQGRLSLYQCIMPCPKTHWQTVHSSISYCINFPLISSPHTYISLCVGTVSSTPYPSHFIYGRLYSSSDAIWP